MRPGTSERFDREAFLCVVCQRPVLWDSVRDEPVNDEGWFQTIRTLRHRDGTEHRVPVGMMFRKL